jgi:hypothetical protein
MFLYSIIELVTQYSFDVFILCSSLLYVYWLGLISLNLQIF